MPATFDNPILPGFHPDPSICRQEDGLKDGLRGYLTGSPSLDNLTQPI
jgi:hypothetical protein